jgi:hypothetical protein
VQHVAQQRDRALARRRDLGRRLRAQLVEDARHREAAQRGLDLARDVGREGRRAAALQHVQRLLEREAALDGLRGGERGGAGGAALGGAAARQPC